ncbi:MAG: hypothetical protein ACI4IK_02950 [Eubacterium sp.]
MANTINAITKYLPYLDEVYKYGSRSAILETPTNLVRETADAKTVMIAKTSMQGLGNYDKASGFVNGDVSLTWESHTFSYDRGRSFTIDAVDDLETLGLAFGTLAAEFLRTQVVPEIDAVRFAKYCTSAGNKATGTLSAENVVSEIEKAETTMKEEEVDLMGAIIFMTPTVKGYIKDDTAHFTRQLVPSENPNRNFGFYDEMPIVEVPQSRFYSAVTLKDGKTEGQEAGGYEKTTTTGKDINFMIIKPEAVVQITKHAKIRVFEPDVNQQADAYKIDYRIYHDGWVLENKKNGIYAHTKA